MKIKFAVLFISVLSISSCGGSSEDEALSADELSAYAEEYSRGWSDGCYDIFYTTIANGTLYANNTPVTYEQCELSIGVPDYPDSVFGGVEEKGYSSGRIGALDFAFVGDRSLCFGDECISRNSGYW